MPDHSMSDEKQRTLALNPTESFIVQAPAGSGKTELLIQRYLTLLCHVKKPEEILSITFTKKAANEMRLRVIKAITSARYEAEPAAHHAKKTWLIAKKVLERDDDLNWNIILNPNQLRIQTIDSLCSTLTNHLPLLAHFGAPPSISTDQHTLYQEAIQRVLFQIEENQPWSPDIEKLLLHLDNDLNKLLELLVSMLKQRDQWLPYIHLDSKTNIKEILEDYLSIMINESLESIYSALPLHLTDELCFLADYAASHLKDNPASPIYACLGMNSLTPDAGSLPQWRGIASLLLKEEKIPAIRKTVNKSNGFPAPSDSKNPIEKEHLKLQKERIIALLNHFSEHEDFINALHEVKFLPDAEYTDNQWDILQSLFKVLKVCAAQLRVSFQQHGMIDYIENAQAAIYALGTEENPTDLALAMDYQIKHILIDEFQDTSLTQQSLIEKLIAGWEPDDGRTLFIVGDPMQSIYRFREAEVGLFIRLREHGIKHLHLTPLTLTVNFRSTPKIITWNNNLFKKIFPLVNSIATGSVTYTKSVPNASVETNQENSFVALNGFNDSMAGAAYIAQSIMEIRTKYPNESIAILVRSRACLSPIIPQLKKAGIPYQAVDIDPITSRQIIQDLIAITRALIHPADNIAWLSILRAPLCGLTLHDLYQISGNHHDADIFSRICNVHVIATLSEDGQQRIHRIMPILKWAVSQRQRLSIRNLVETIWLQSGGPACLNDESDINDVKTFFNLLDKMESENLQIDIESLMRHVKQLFAKTSHGIHAVQLMTIHNAKGLEFDSVFLPHLETKTPNDDKRLLLWMERPLSDGSNALLLAPIHAASNKTDKLYDYIRRQLKVKLELEIDRLLYVAATRAKKRLLITFNVTQNENGSVKTESGSFLKKCWPVFEVDPLLELEVGIKNNTVPSNDHTIRKIKRLTAAWKNPINLLPTSHYNRHQEAPGFNLPDETRRLIGNTIHQLLQQISLHGIDWWQARSPDKQYAYLTRILFANGITHHEMDNAAKQTYKMINNTINDTFGSWILQNNQEAKSEFALTAILDGKVRNMVIDRTFIDENNIRWIIDYKTAIPHDNESIESFLDAQMKQHEPQLQAYHHAFTLMEKRPIKTGLYYPALQVWQECYSP